LLEQFDFLFENGLVMVYNIKGFLNNAIFIERDRP
jgi:hypothetical protein